MGQFVFLRHGDTTMQLNGLFSHQSSGTPKQVLTGRQHHIAGSSFILKISSGIDHSRSGLFQLDQNISHSVLQRLKRANRATKLLTRHQIFAGQRCRCFHCPKRFRTLCNNPKIDGAIQSIRSNI